MFCVVSMLLNPMPPKYGDAYTIARGNVLFKPSLGRREYVSFCCIFCSLSEGIAVAASGYLSAGSAMVL